MESSTDAKIGGLSRELQFQYNGLKLQEVSAIQLLIIYLVILPYLVMVRNGKCSKYVMAMEITVVISFNYGNHTGRFGIFETPF